MWLQLIWWQELDIEEWLFSRSQPVSNQVNLSFIIYQLFISLRTEQHPARVGSLPSGAATRAFFYKTVFLGKTVLVKISARLTAKSLESKRGKVIQQKHYGMYGKCLMLFLTFWLLFGQAKSNKACMADARQNENEKQNEYEESDLNQLEKFLFWEETKNP